MASDLILVEPDGKCHLGWDLLHHFILTTDQQVNSGLAIEVQKAVHIPQGHAESRSEPMFL